MTLFQCPLPPMPLLPITSPTTLEKCKSFRLRPSDVFVCSYPKSGTTWTQQIVVSLILADRRRYRCQSHNEIIDEACTNAAGTKQRQQRRQRLQQRNNDYGCAAETTASTPSSDGSMLFSYNHISDFAPFFEIDAHWESRSHSLVERVRENHNKLKRRVFNSHLRWDMLPKESEQHEETTGIASASLLTFTENTNCFSKGGEHLKRFRPSCGKFIYVTRNLPDVCVSFYHHLSNQMEGTYTLDFATFVRDWMDGNKIPFGSPLHHLLSFAEGFCDNQYSNSLLLSDRHQCCVHKDDRPLLLLSYENMKMNLRHEVLKLIDFLHLDNISMEVLEEELLPTFDFQFMKENAHIFQPKSVTWLNGFQFLRKGEVGDGTKMLLMNKIVMPQSNNTSTTTFTTEHNDEESEDTVSLMVMYRDWVNREGYRQKISELESFGLTREASAHFRAVVEECTDYS